MTPPRKLPSTKVLASNIVDSYLERGQPAVLRLLIADRNSVLEAAAEVAEKHPQSTAFHIRKLKEEL